MPRKASAYRSLSIKAITNDIVQLSCQPTQCASSQHSLQEMKLRCPDDYLYRLLYDRSIDYVVDLSTVRGAEQRFLAPYRKNPTIAYSKDAVVDEHGWVKPRRLEKLPNGALQINSKGSQAAEQQFDAAQLCCIELEYAASASRRK